MQLSIERKKLLSTLKMLNSYTYQNTRNRTLDLLLNVSGDRVTLRLSDSAFHREVTLNVGEALDVTIIENGTTLLPYHELKSFCKSCKGKEPITLTESSFSQDKALMPYEEKPDPSAYFNTPSISEKNRKNITIDAGILASLINGLLPFTSVSSLNDRDTFLGVNLAQQGENYRAAATDTYALGINTSISMGEETTDDWINLITLPKPTVKALTHYFNDVNPTGNCYITSDNQWTKAQVEGLTLWDKAIKDTFPKIETVLPLGDVSGSMVVNRENFLATLLRCRQLADPNTKGVKLVFDNNNPAQVCLTNGQYALRKFQVFHKCICNRESGEVVYNIDHLINALKLFVSDSVSFEWFNEQWDMGVLLSPESVYRDRVFSQKVLVMPIRSY